MDVLIRGGHQPVLGAGSRSWTPRHGGVPLETQAHLALVGLLRALPAADVAQAINSVMGFPALFLDAGTTHGGRWRGAVGLELKRPGYPEGPLLEQVRRQMADRDQHAPNASLLWLGGQDPPSALLDLADQRFRATSLADLTDVLVSVGNVDGETRELARRAVESGGESPPSRGHPCAAPSARVARPPVWRSTPRFLLERLGRPRHLGQPAGGRGPSTGERPLARGP